MDSDFMCKMDIDMLEDYVDNCLSRPETLLIEAHIKSCSVCRKFVSELKLLFWELDRAAKEPVDIPDDIGSLGILIRKAAIDDSAKKNNGIKFVFNTSAGVLRNAFSFTQYVIPSVNPGIIKSYGYKLRDKAVKSGRRYLKRRISGILGGKA